MTTNTSESDQEISSWFVDVLVSEASAINQAAERVGTEVVAAVRLIAAAKGRLIVTGMGKMGCIARKAAGTFSSTGTPAVFLEPADAMHGGLGLIGAGDVLLAISNSGETTEVLGLSSYCLRHGLSVIAITGSHGSSLGKQASVVIDSGVVCEADPDSLAPTNSSTVALACCDGLAVSLMRLRGFTKEQFAIFHPGGHLGRKLLLKVQDLMHAGDQIPLVSDKASLQDSISMISTKGMGCVLVADSNRQLKGILTDGDVRRIFEATAQSADNPMLRPVATFMTTEPSTISVDSLAAEALSIMEQRQITSLPVLGELNGILGILHMHDLIRSGLA